MSVSNIISSYLRSRSVEDRDDLGWTRWYLDTKPAGEVYAIDISEYIDRVYAIRVLRALASLSDDQIRADTLPSDRRIQTLIASPESPLRKAIEAVAKPESKWHPFVPKEGADRLAALSELFTKTLKEAAEREAAEIRAATISEAKVEELRKEAVEELEKTSTIMPLARKAGVLLTSSTAPEGIKPITLGYNTVASKEAFIENWHVNFVDFGEQYGRGIANGIDRMTVEALAGVLPDWAIPVKEPTDLSAQLWAAIGVLEKSGINEVYALTSLNLDLSFPQVSDFIPRWHRDCREGLEKDIPGFVGCFQHEGHQPIPVFRIHHSAPSLNRIFMLVDFRSLGAILQLPPSDDPADNVLIRGGVLVKVNDLNREDTVRVQILGEKPKWLMEMPDPEAHLKDRALVKVQVRLAFQFSKNPKGYKFVVAKTRQLQ